MSIRWLSASFFVGFVAQKGPFYFELRQHQSWVLRVYLPHDPGYRLWQFTGSCRSCKACAKDVLSRPSDFLSGDADYRQFIAARQARYGKAVAS
jgi:hypothetical protein